mmetsp:Transcript_3002/g.7481  ORF Transcript_3002/g.7481 Transcript_3002/m.7481 type:complete len:194 (-) Transcript_3002:290-871(-)
MANRSFLQDLMQMLGGTSEPAREQEPAMRRDEEDAWYEGTEEGESSRESCVVGGADFGFSDLARLESCVVEARERCTAGQYFEQELAAIERNFNEVKALVARQDGGLQGGRDASCDDERLHGEARALSHKISQLLSELDEKEWDMGSDDEGFAQRKGSVLMEFALDAASLLHANSCPAAQYFRIDACDPDSTA